jgi:hypothetical protein
MTARTVSRRRTPPASAFLSDFGSFYYWDSYEAPLRRGDLAMHEIHLALFAHRPRWARWLLILRGWIVAPFGLKATTAAELDSIEIKPAYAVGDKIARFILYAQSDTEIVTGGNDRHLDFRVSVHKLTLRRQDDAVECDRSGTDLAVEQNQLFAGSAPLQWRVILYTHRRMRHWSGALPANDQGAVCASRAQSAAGTRATKV